MYSRRIGRAVELDHDWGLAVKVRVLLRDVFSRLQVDCTSNTEVCGRFGVTGYPTLKLFKNGVETSTYDGPRSSGVFVGGCLGVNPALWI